MLCFDFCGAVAGVFTPLPKKPHRGAYEKATNQNLGRGDRSRARGDAVGGGPERDGIRCGEQ